VEEATLVVAVQGIIGGIEVENDLVGQRRVRFEEQVHRSTNRRSIAAASCPILW
jgi:hypothetical protein